MTRSIPPAIESRWSGATVVLGASGVSRGRVVRVEWIRGRYIAVVTWGDGEMPPTREPLTRLRIVEADRSGLESAT
jgi:hypothetical protein